MKKFSLIVGMTILAAILCGCKVTHIIHKTADSPPPKYEVKEAPAPPATLEELTRTLYSN